MLLFFKCIKILYLPRAEPIELVLRLLVAPVQYNWYKAKYLRAKYGRTINKIDIINTYN